MALCCAPTFHLVFVLPSLSVRSKTSFLDSARRAADAQLAQRVWASCDHLPLAVPLVHRIEPLLDQVRRRLTIASPSASSAADSQLYWVEEYAMLQRRRYLECMNDNASYRIPSDFKRKYLAEIDNFSTACIRPATKLMTQRVGDFATHKRCQLFQRTVGNSALQSVATQHPT